MISNIRYIFLRAFVIFFLCLFEISTSSAQTERKITIIGRVFDENHNPLIGASIIDRISNTGVSTNKDGMFSLTQQSQKIYFQIEYTGYKPFPFSLNSDSIKSINDSTFLNFVMEIKSEQLDTIVVRAEKTSLAYNKPGVIILDYDFYKEYFLLLIYEGQKYKLRITDELSSNIYTISLRGNPDKLFRDCYNNLHVLSSDSTFQLDFKETEIILLKGHSINEFNEYVSPLVTATQGNLFYKTYGKHNQSMTYYKYDKIKNTKNEFKKIDAKSLANFANTGINLYRHSSPEQLVSVPVYYQGQVVAGMNYLYQKQNNAPPTGFYPNAPWESSLKKLDGKDEAFYQTILTIPIYNPLFKLRDSLFLFDHTEDIILVYNSDGIFVRKFPIFYHHKKGWKNQLIVDYFQKEVYTKYTYNDHTYLMKISLDNGQILNQVKLEHKLAKDIKIKNKYAYFIYKDRDAGITFDYLYKQKLE